MAKKKSKTGKKGDDALAAKAEDAKILQDIANVPPASVNESAILEPPLLVCEQFQAPPVEELTRVVQIRDLDCALHVDHLLLEGGSFNNPSKCCCRACTIRIMQGRLKNVCRNVAETAKVDIQVTDIDVFLGALTELSVRACLQVQDVSMARSLLGHQSALQINGKKVRIRPWSEYKMEAMDYTQANPYVACLPHAVHVPYLGSSISPSQFKAFVSFLLDKKMLATPSTGGVDPGIIHCRLWAKPFGEWKCGYVEFYNPVDVFKLLDAFGQFTYQAKKGRMPMGGSDDFAAIYPYIASPHLSMTLYSPGKKPLAQLSHFAVEKHLTTRVAAVETIDKPFEVLSNFSTPPGLGGGVPVNDVATNVVRKSTVSPPPGFDILDTAKDCASSPTTTRDSVFESTTFTPPGLTIKNRVDENGNFCPITNDALFLKPVIVCKKADVGGNDEPLFVADSCTDSKFLTIVDFENLSKYDDDNSSSSPAWLIDAFRDCSTTCDDTFGLIPKSTSSLTDPDYAWLEAARGDVNISSNDAPPKMESLREEMAALKMELQETKKDSALQLELQSSVYADEQVDLFRQLLEERLLREAAEQKAQELVAKYSQM